MFCFVFESRLNKHEPGVWLKFCLPPESSFTPLHTKFYTYLTSSSLLGHKAVNVTVVSVEIDAAHSILFFIFIF